MLSASYYATHLRCLVLASAFTLTSCGGDGQSESPASSVSAAPSPVPSPPPPPPPASPPPAVGAIDPIIFAASGSQMFADEGRYLRSDGGITVRFDSVTGRYLVTTPGNTTPEPLQRDPKFSPAAGAPWTNFVLPGCYFLIRASGIFPDPRRYLYSNLAVWGCGAGDISGATAFGIPTQMSNMPQQGSMTYTGFLEGTSNERYSSDGASYYAGIDGTITLTFDSVTSKASVTIAPRLGSFPPANHGGRARLGAWCNWVPPERGGEPGEPGLPLVRAVHRAAGGGAHWGPQAGVYLADRRKPANSRRFIHC
jgi:hypothetical protein